VEFHNYAKKNKALKCMLILHSFKYIYTYFLLFFITVFSLLLVANFLLFLSVCDSPPSPQINAVASADNSTTFFVSDSIMYSCNGNLIPDYAVIATCVNVTESSGGYTEWSIPTTDDLPLCRKFTLFIRK